MDDDIHEGIETVVVRGTNEDPGLSVSGVRIGIEDNDAGPTGIALSLNKSIVAEEGGPQQLTVTATLQGSMEPADRELRLTLAGGTAMTSDYTGLGGTLTIPAGVLEGTSNVVLSPNNDAIDEEDETLEVRGATPLSSLTVSHALVTITDDDTAGVNIRPTTLTVEEGASADYRVSLDTQPTWDVTVSVVVPANSGVAASPATLTFTDTDWNRSQTVSITGDQDDDAADEAPVTLTHTATSGGYSGVDVDSVSVTVTDDDTPEVLLSESSLSVEEGNTAGGTYTVKLSHPPTGEVTVTVTGQAGTDLTITGLSDSNTLTFTTTDWNRRRR